MQADPNEGEQVPPAEPTVNQSEGYTRWVEIGRHATKTGEALGINRKRVGQAVDARLQAVSRGGAE